MSEAISDDELAELRAALEVMTPEPWYAVQYASFWSIQTQEHYGRPDLMDEEKDHRAPFNARGIVLLRNHAASLLDEVVRLRVERDTARDQALEDAAKLADIEHEDPGDDIDSVLTRLSAAIRALKGVKP